MNDKTTGLGQERFSGSSSNEMYGAGSSPSQNTTNQGLSQGGGAAGVTGALRETAQATKEQLKQSATAATQQIKQQGQDALHQLQSTGENLVTQQKTYLVDRIQHCSLASRKAADQLRQDNDPNLAHYAEAFANQLERTSSYIQNRDFRSMYSDVESFARRQPELFFGGMFVAGLALARFLKASRHVKVDDYADYTEQAAYGEEYDWETESPGSMSQPTGLAGTTTPGMSGISDLSGGISDVDLRNRDLTTPGPGPTSSAPLP